jgi:hypothetical protein
VKYSSILPAGSGTIIEDKKAVKHNTLNEIFKIVRNVRKNHLIKGNFVQLGPSLEFDDKILNIFQDLLVSRFGETP